MSDRAPKGMAKAAAYHAYENRTKPSLAAKAYGVKANSVYHAARRCGLPLTATKKGPVR